MNILFLNTNQRNSLNHASGYATHMIKTIEGFRRNGHSVFEYLAGENENIVRTKNRYTIAKSILPNFIAKLMRDIYELIHDRKMVKKCDEIIRRKNIDFIYERMHSYHISGYKASIKNRIPIILEINDPLKHSVSADLSILKPIALLLEKKLLKKATGIILGTKALKKYYVKHGIEEKKLLVIYPTADYNLFRSRKIIKNETKNNDLRKKTIIGFVGTNRPWHRVELLLEALVKLTDKYENVEGLLVGNIDLSNVQKNNLDLKKERIKCTGTIPYVDVPKYLESMDICVIANAVWYGSPTKLFEYAAMKKPVVVPSVESIYEIIYDGVTGMVFKRGNVKDLVAKIEFLLENAKERKRIGEKLYNDVKNEYDWDKNTKKIIEYIKKNEISKQ